MKRKKVNNQLKAMTCSGLKDTGQGGSGLTLCHPQTSKEVCRE